MNRDCSLCVDPGGTKVWTSADWRVIRAEDENFPAFYRVIANEHVREFSQVPAESRQRCMDIVALVERVLLREISPTKVNLAQLGNLVPHVHWHVIARFEWDSHFPEPIWAMPQREQDCLALDQLRARLRSLDDAVSAALESADAEIE